MENKMQEVSDQEMEEVLGGQTITLYSYVVDFECDVCHHKFQTKFLKAYPDKVGCRNPEKKCTGFAFAKNVQRSGGTINI